MEDILDKIDDDNLWDILDNFSNDKNSSYSLGTLSDSDNTNYSEYSDLSLLDKLFDRLGKSKVLNATPNMPAGNSSNLSA